MLPSDMKNMKEDFLMQTSLTNQDSIFSGSYWQKAASNLKNNRMLAFAGLIIALRVVVKAFKIPLAPGLTLTLDCYVNALGSVVYGPVIALLAGAVSDTLGCILFPSPTSPYFFPFILVEMSSGFIFALFLWERTIDIKKTLLSKFTVNMICNIILTSLLIKWSNYLEGKTYNLITLVRLCKNLVLFPLESMLIVIVLKAAIPPLSAIGFKGIRFTVDKLEKKHYLYIALLALVSVGLVLFYVFWLKDFAAANNFKWL